MFKRLFSILLLIGLSTLLFGQAGKISGVIKDSETGEPLPGVNVVLEETLLGAATDVDGFFVILNVPPGTYTVSISYIGYQDKKIENVRVVSDITKRLTIELTPTTVELDSAIVVTAEKPFFEESATNTVRVLDSEEIERVPVKGINSIVSLNAGVVSTDGSGGVTGNATINVRGGRATETLVVVDGVPLNDPLGFGTATIGTRGGNVSSGVLGSIPDAAIEQVSSQLGGFSAKYGSAQSAVINITTKSGASKYFGQLEYVTSGIGRDRSTYNTYLERANPIVPAGANEPSDFDGLTEKQKERFLDILGEDELKDNYTGFDDYGYNQVTATLGGPIIPGNNKYSFFGSFEFIDALDGNPKAIGLEIPDAGIDRNSLPDNEESTMRFTGKIDANVMESLKLTGSVAGSFRDYRGYVHTYAKTNSFHNTDNIEDVLSGSLKLSHIINKNTYWDLTVRGKFTDFTSMDGFWEDDIMAYGDSVRNAAIGVELPQGDGSRVRPEAPNRIFHSFGRVFNRYLHYEIENFGGEFDFTTQLENHLIEIGGTVDQNKLRYYSLGPIDLSLKKDVRTLEERFYQSVRSYFGYNIFGPFEQFGGQDLDEDQNRIVEFSQSADTDLIQEFGAPTPITAGAYVQDKIEFKDFIVNLGLRLDYFDPQYFRFKDPRNPFRFGDPSQGENKRLDPDDLEEMPTESYVSPRLGFAFPVTEFTVFHAQYGVFRQAPRLLDLYDSWLNWDDIEVIDGQGQNNGHLKHETTISYEFGFKQQFGNKASLDITAYYKNIKGLTNLGTIVTTEGNNYITTINSDFGTIKGLAFQFNLRRLGPVSAKIDYTLAQNEGTGSSQSSSFTATFRNPDFETPKAIAPLDFDQTHTLTASIDIRAAKGEGPTIAGMKLLENTGVNFLVTYQSGRPYTPVQFWNPTVGITLQGNLTQYINSARADGVFKVDMKVDKRFNIAGLTFKPYLWVQNLLDRDNVVDVYRSTGEADDSAFLESPDGQRLIRQNGPSYESDFKALERDPTNYGIPRLVRLGLQIKF